VYANLRRCRFAEPRGFTLIEVLVVLVIVSLLMTILTQALWMGLDMLRRSRADMTAQAVEAMRLQWYREAVAGLQPERTGGAHVFRGSERRFSGLTTGAPTENLGATLPVTFELEFDAAADKTRLKVGVGTSAQATTLLAWPGRVGEFVYLDETGLSHESWPPAGAAQLQLPRVIVLKARPVHAGPVLVYTAIAGDRRTPRRIDQVMGGDGVAR
jgi:general secretion pathway protein J